MTREKEEILNDPGNYTLLKHVSRHGSQELEEVEEKTGIDSERLKHKSQILHEKNFLERNHGRSGIVLEINQETRTNLEDFRQEIMDFIQEKSEMLGESIKEERLDLEKARKKFEYEKDETELVGRKKKIDRKIKAVDSTLEKLERREDGSRELFEAFSTSHRILIFLGEREEEFHGFNPTRKLKTLEKIEHILEEEPSEEKEPRRFFGNRWVTSRNLK